LDAFLHRLQQTICRSRRHNEHQSALLLISLKGKAKTKTLREKLNPLTRFEDTIEVLPENQIAIILEDLSHVSDPLRVAKRLREAAGKSANEMSIVVIDGRHEKAEDYYQAAVKTLSSERPTFSDRVADEQAQARLQLEADLDEALVNGDLVAHYQPIFNLRHGKLTGFEALVRWQHPTRGLLLPGAFLDIADRRGQLLEIDEFMLKQALIQIPIWNAISEKPIYVSANLASDHFLKPENLTTLIETLNAHQKSLDLLRIDVSEQVLFDQEGIDSLNTLDMLRIGFNLDDFGVDSESFHCLGSFPFNSLKIDRTLICQMEDEVNAELIVAVLRIAKRMGMKTIAEGVVTHAQLEELRNLGCTEAQGFLFSEAVPLDEASALINHEYRW
jgi:EAL domain-containing protein (putative c-di-GMP-specific phosphodiesterase class I)